MMHIAPQVMHFQPERLTVDPDVQRTLDQARVDKILKDGFNPGSVGVLVVNQRPDGSLHVIDGQHRRAAWIAAGLGEQPMMCLTYTGLSRAEEAAKFLELNNAKAVQSIDKFRVRVEKGDEVAIELTETLGRHGWRVAQSKNDAAFAAVSALEKVRTGKVGADFDGAAACDAVIAVATEAWGHNADGVSADVVRGLGVLFLRHGSRVNTPKLIAELSAVAGGPRGFIGKAKGLKDFRGGTLYDAVAEIATEMLNKQRRAANRLPEWRSAA